MADMNLKAMLTKKLGPLPAWGWGLVIGGGYLGYRVLSGKGISLTGGSAPVEQVPAYEDTTGNGSGPGYGGGGGSGSSWGDTPIVTVINEIPGVPDNAVDPIDKTDTTDLQAQLIASKAYALKMKQRGNDWAEWGRRWKKVATRKASNNAKRGTGTKTKNTGQTKRRGTQGTQILKPAPRSPLQRRQDRKPVMPRPSPEKHRKPTPRKRRK